MKDTRVTVAVLGQKIDDMKETLIRVEKDMSEVTSVAYSAKAKISEHISNHKISYITFTAIVVIIQLIFNIAR